MMFYVEIRTPYLYFLGLPEEGTMHRNREDAHLFATESAARDAAEAFVRDPVATPATTTVRVRSVMPGAIKAKAKKKPIKISLKEIEAEFSDADNRAAWRLGWPKSR